jgi:pimeloyl-ACP methyl ester carboxylesterase
MFVAAGGFLLNTVEFGSGSRTFLAHGGWVGSWELWQEPFQLMQSRWRCISYDHRGSGASTAPPAAISPQALVDDLFAVLDHYNVERCVLAGESLGALTCLQAVLQAPERFDGLVIVDGVPAASAGSQMLIDGSRADYPATVKAFVDHCLPEPESDHLRRWGRQILLRADPEAAARLLESHLQEQIAPALNQLDAPTLIIQGEHDVIVTMQDAQHMADTIPTAQLVVIPDAGHVPTLSRPAQVVAAIDAWAAGLAT